MSKRFIYKRIKDAIPNRLLAYRGSGSKSVVALTFDDGPHPGNSARLLDTLTRHGIRATFFINGSAVEGNEGFVADAIERGCEIGNHFYHHISVADLNYDAMKEEIETCWKSVRNICPGKEFPKILRPPYGKVDLKILFWALRHGWTIVLWSRDSLDSQDLDHDQKMKYIREMEIGTGDIILMHDDAEYLDELLESVIRRVREKGLDFVTISEILGLRHGSAGRVQSQS